MKESVEASLEVSDITLMNMPLGFKKFILNSVKTTIQILPGEDFFERFEKKDEFNTDYFTFNERRRGELEERNDDIY